VIEIKMITDILRDKKILAFLVITFLFFFVIYSSIPFISAFFGAIILAFLFHPFDKFMRKRFNFSKEFSAFLIILISIILVIIPTVFLVQGLVGQLKILPSQLENLALLENTFSDYFSFDISFDKAFISESVIPFLTNSLTPIFSNILQAFAILFLLFFLMYYIIIYFDELEDKVHDILPFNEKNRDKAIEKFRAITYSTIIGTFLIALIQGGLLAVNFYFLNVPNALFWGFVTVILSFLPIIGPPVVWGPVAIFFFINGDFGKGSAILIAGILISTIDNILRPIINEKYGKIHPVVSIVGIYIGIMQFGILGIFVGPLIVAYLVLFWKMYKEEYLRKSRK
jgi:predicted PurR-regulated permease PerM